MVKKKSASTTVGVVAKKGPRLYIVLEVRDNAPVCMPSLKERDAYQEKNAFAESGIACKVVAYEPA